MISVTANMAEQYRRTPFGVLALRGYQESVQISIRYGRAGTVRH
ncbi:hypothetical protein [Brenneria izadpanahii]|nr:hypothetical protein [Brenneria izadpanahii]